jgi:hypothetical protein
MSAAEPLHSASAPAFGGSAPAGLSTQLANEPASVGVVP